MNEKILLVVIGSICVIGTYGVCGVLTAIALACDIGGGEC